MSSIPDDLFNIIVDKFKIKDEDDNGYRPRYVEYAEKAAHNISPSSILIGNYTTGYDAYQGRITQIYFNPECINLIKIDWAWGTCTGCDAYINETEENIQKCFDERNTQIMNFDDIFGEELKMLEWSVKGNYIHKPYSYIKTCKNLLKFLQKRNYIHDDGLLLCQLYHII